MLELASRVAASKGELHATDLARAVSLFAVQGLVDSSQWSDEPIPVCEAGLMIVDAAAVVNQLKAGPWQQARQFLGGAALAGEFFAPYTGDGDGLAVLKTQYAANQAEIDSKFGELKRWVAQKEQEAGSGN